jgi:iron complex outermembrane receptor protein
MHSHVRSLHIVTVAAALSLLGIEQAAAQVRSDASQPNRHQHRERREVVLQEIIVTAQKRRQRAFDVPISLAVLDSRQLSRRHITNLEELQFAVPGLTVQATGNQRRIDIRGISNVFGNGALVGEYIDEADATPAGFGAAFGYGAFDMRTYDLQRIEVLRGPQGTLYGEGSMGGTIRLITNKPVLNQFQMNTDMEASFTQYGAPSQRIDAMINTPLATDTFGLRFVGEFDHEGGWIDQPAANLKNINGENLADVRIEGLWEPLRNLKVNAMEIIHRNAFGPDIGEDASGNYTQAFNFTTTPNSQENFNFSNTTVAYDVSGVRMLSSTTYFTHSMDTRNWSAVFPYPPLSQVYAEYLPSFVDQSKNLSEELRLTRLGQAAWQWTLGGLYKRFDDSEAGPYFYGLEGPPATPPPPSYPFAESEYSHSWAAFGDTSYTLARRLTLGGGARYFRDRQSLNNGTLQDATFQSIDPRVYARYEITGDVSAYASAAKGFRSGGFNALGQPPYRPETVWTYEAGTKMRFEEGRLTADGDVFVSDYGNFVIVGFLPDHPVNIYRNAGAVRIKGVEGDVAWRPLDSWLLSLTGDYINGRFVEVGVLDASYRVGDPVDFVPRYAVSASVEREFTLQGRSGFARFDYSQRAPESYRVRNLGPWYYAESSHLYLLNFSTGIQLTGQGRLGFFAKNLLNDRGFMDSDVIEHLAARARPRTFGISFRWELD